MQAVPTEIRAPRDASVIEIDWDDGVTSRLSLRVLRGFCPCARCQGHSGRVNFVEGDHSELVDIEEVGDYALRLAFPDCGTGLYTYGYLRRLSTIDDSQLVSGMPLPA